MNRQGNRNHPQHNQPRGRGGRGSGYRRDRGGRAENLPPVPSSSQVRQGVGVSIVLKVDQPTGHQVQGIVDEVLGRGDHPRGIKVRLIDGRVGRVQAIVSEEVAREASAGLTGLGRNGEAGGSINLVSGGMAGRREAQFTDVRYDDNAYYYDGEQAAREPPSWMDYIKPAKVSKSSKKQPTAPTQGEAEASSQAEHITPETITCPVCGAFEGDEEAVAHHVNSHFD